MLWITAILALVFLTSAVRGWRMGFGFVVVDLIGFVLATLAASFFYLPFARLAELVIALPGPFINLTVFIILWMAVEAVYRIVLGRYRQGRLFMPESAATLPSQLGGALLSLTQTALLVTLSLVVLLALPISGNLKNALSQAPISRQLLALGGRYQEKVNGGVANLAETLNFLTVKPKSEESIKLGFSTTHVTIDEAGERQLLDLVNHERTSRGLNMLVEDDGIRAVARAHSKDMFARGYFSHVTPEGTDPFQRMRDGGVIFVAAGENLALAPTIDLAHVGLMNSPEHRANILETSFRRVGIGVIDGGIFGLMVTEDFAD